MKLLKTMEFLALCAANDNDLGDSIGLHDMSPLDYKASIDPCKIKSDLKLLSNLAASCKALPLSALSEWFCVGLGYTRAASLASTGEKPIQVVEKAEIAQGALDI